jgi:tRNA A-37 threonylcarbamoyl transferase component Bud32
MSPDLPGELESALTRGDPAFIAALPFDLSAEAAEDTDLSELSLSKGLFAVYPRYYIAASALTAITFAFGLWVLLLLAAEYLSLRQALTLQFPLQLFTTGSEGPALGYRVYAIFAVCLTIGSAISALLWYYAGAPSEVREELAVAGLSGYTLVIGLVCFGLATIGGPLLYLLALLAALVLVLLAIVSLLGVFALLYGLVKADWDIAGGGLIALACFVLVSLLISRSVPTPYWVQESPLLASTYILSVLLLFAVPGVGAYVQLPLAQWGVREFLYRYASIRLLQVLDPTTTRNSAHRDRPIPDRILYDNVENSEFVSTISELEDIQTVATGIAEVETQIKENEFKRASHRLRRIEPLIRPMSSSSLNPELVLNGSQDVQLVEQRCDELESRYYGVREQLKTIREIRTSLSSQLDTITRRCDEADELVQSGELAESRSLLAELSTELETIERNVEDRGLSSEALGSQLSDTTAYHSSLKSCLEDKESMAESTISEANHAREQLVRTETLLDDGNLEKAQARITMIQSQLHSLEDRLESSGLVDILERVCDLESRCDSQLERVERMYLERIDDHCAAARGSVKQAADNSVGDEQRIALYEDAKNELIAASELAQAQDIGDISALEEKLRDVVERRDGIVLQLYGRRVAEASPSNMAAESANNEAFDQTIENLESLLAELENTESVRAEDLDLIRREAATRLEDARFAREKQRVEQAHQLFEDDEYAGAIAAFETANQELEFLHEQGTAPGGRQTASEITNLAEICAENASLVKKTELGLMTKPDLSEAGTRTHSESAGHSDSDADAIENDPAQGGSTKPVPTSGGTLDLSYADFDRGERIGSGGNADVYLSTFTEKDTTRTVALKEPRMRGTILAESVERFAREANTWSKLDRHDNIVSVVAYGSAPVPWIALEHMEQGDLSAVDSNADMARKLSLATQVTDAVWHAHQRGVAHLDLKPQNILLSSSEDGSGPVAKVADWGLSKMLLENSASVEGLSPQYSAPEQFDADEHGSPDNKTDIFQLGVIFYELFAGQHPFGGSATAAIHGILNASPVPPREHAPGLPEKIDDIVLTAMAKSKSDRYEAVVYMRDALRSVEGPEQR